MDPNLKRALNGLIYIATVVNAVKILWDFSEATKARETSGLPVVKQRPVRRTVRRRPARRIDFEDLL